tara:strand:+ start:509 stop:706 length:198 start_codon:yes stop_codon:yes gene_type:complete
MKMLNRIEASTTPRLEITTEVEKMQITLNRMYDDLNPIATPAENDIMQQTYLQLDSLLMELRLNA